MGNLLIIRNADFSANAVERVILSELVSALSQSGVFVLWYNNSCNIQQAGSQAPSLDLVANTKLLAVNVRGFEGRTVRIKSANYVLSGAYYDCFTSDLGGLTLSDISNLATVDSNANYNTPVTVIEYFNVSTTTTGEVKEITKTVPVGANYLLVTARFDEGLTEADLSVTLVD